MSDTSTAPFTTYAPRPGTNDPALPDGQQTVTEAEMRFLKEWSWGPDAYRVKCKGKLDSGEACPDTMVFERDPADWPNHPGEPGDVRVKIECPTCGGTQYTDGMTEKDYFEKRVAELTGDIRGQAAAAIAEETEVVQVSGSETAGASDFAAPPQPAE